MPASPDTPAHDFRELAPGSFIYAMNNALTASLCTDMVKRFEENPDQQYKGRLGQSADQNSDIKRSTDLRISGREDWNDVDTALRQSLATALGLLAELHPFFKSNPLHDVGYNMQRTLAGEFYHWHIDGGPGDFAKRQLVAIWYLSERSSVGGTTDFHFQNLEIEPAPGKLILFPPFWTHPHRGARVESGTKYIATTWVCVK